MVVRALPLCALLSALPSTNGLVRAQGVVPELMTDTAAYCEHLRTRVSVAIGLAVSAPPAEVSELVGQADTLCGHGHYRGGVQRLRRALVILQHQPGAMIQVAPSDHEQQYGR